MKWYLLGLVCVLLVGTLAINPVCAIEDDVEWYGSLHGTDFTLKWDSYSYVSPTTLPAEHDTNRVMYIGYTGYHNSWIKTGLMNTDYFAFTFYDYIQSTTVSGKYLYEIDIKYYNRENALIGTINFHDYAETYDSLNRWEFKKDGSIVDLYIDGSYVHTYTLDSPDSLGYIQIYCPGGQYTGYTNGNPYTYYKAIRAKIDDVSSTGSIVGSRDEWDDSTTDVVAASYGIDYYNYYGSSEFELRLIDTSDSEVLATTTPTSSTGFLSVNRTEVFGTDYGLYKYSLTRDAVEIATKYIVYKPTITDGTIAFDQENYVSSETATLTYNIPSPDFTTYTYEAEIVTVNGEVLDTETIAEASGTYDVTFTDWETGTYFVLFSKTDKNSGESTLFAYDYCDINVAVKFVGDTLLFNGTAVGDADVSFLQVSTYYNTTSDATTGAYERSDLSMDIATTCNATATNVSMAEFTITPQAAGVIDLDLILFPNNMTDYWGANNTTAYGMVYGTYHAPVEGATVTISNDTWTDTTTTSSTGFYAFHGLVNNSSYSVNAAKTGFRTSSDYPISTNNNVRQDIEVYELYTVTIDAKESAMSTPVLDFTAVFDGTAYESSTAGIVTVTGVEAGIYSLAVGSTDYYTYSSNVAVLGDKSVTATLTSSLSGGSSGGIISGSFTEPHTAEFIYLSYWMARYPGVYVTVYEGHQDDVIVNGAPSSSATEVANMTSGDTGAVSFELNKTTTYTLYAVSTDPEFTKITSMAPQDSRYYIFIGANPFTSDDNVPVDSIYYGTIGGKVNLTTAQINASFQDISNSTVLAEWWVNDSLDNQLYYASTTDNSTSWSTYVDVDDNETYFVHFQIDSGALTESKHVTKTYRFYNTVHPAFDFGFTEQWQYNAIAAFFIILITGLFSVRDSHFGAIVAVIMGWLAVYIGYIEPTTTSSLSMTFATMIAGMMYLRKQERF